MAQIACIIASLPLLHMDYCGGIWILFLCATIALFSTIFIMRYFVTVIPTNHTESTRDGFLQGFTQGLYLLCTRPYPLCILIISGAYEITAQIIEYQTLSLAVHHADFATTHGFAQFQGIFGIAIHSVSLLIALLGTRYVIKRYSLKGCLLAVPMILLIILITYLIFYQSSTQMLWISMTLMILIDGIGYAINTPIKEMLYIPTSTDIKFKSKSWIDIFGIRTAKQTGAQINHMFKDSLPQLILFGTLCGIGLTIAWIFAAYYVGNKNKKLIETKTIIE